MHKYCGDEQLLACHYPYGMCNSCCSASTVLPRHDEWLCYGRSLTDNYKKNFKQTFDTPLWRRAKRTRKPPNSMLNLHTAKSQVARFARQTATNNKRKSKKKQQQDTRPAHIIIERPAECKGGYLRMLAETPNFDCQRMRALLLQQALYNECNCDPYDLLPTVPLTYYPKWSYNHYKQSAADFLRYINSDGPCCPNAKKRLSKDFLASLNKLYANVGGGKNAAFDFNNYFYGPADREHEFQGFFGHVSESTFRLRLGSAITNVRNSHLVQPRGWSSLTNRSSQSNPSATITRYRSPTGILDIESSAHSFRYPTKISEENRRNFKTSPNQILKYLGVRKASKKFKRNA